MRTDLVTPTLEHLLADFYASRELAARCIEVETSRVGGGCLAPHAYDERAGRLIRLPSTADARDKIRRSIARTSVQTLGLDETAPDTTVAEFVDGALAFVDWWQNALLGLHAPFGPPDDCGRVVDDADVLRDAISTDVPVLEGMLAGSRDILRFDRACR